LQVQQTFRVDKDTIKVVMSEEYRNAFIASLILSDDFPVVEYDSFKAKMYGYSSIPKFSIKGYWDLCFDIKNGVLTWMVVKNGVIEMEGTVHISLRDEPGLKHGCFDVYDENANEFIATMLPVGTKIVQLYPDENIFLINDVPYDLDENILLVNDTPYDFDDMSTIKKYIYFEFK